MRAPPGPHGGCFYWGDGWCHSLRRRLVVPERSLRVWASAAGGLGHPGGLLWRWTCRTCSWLENQGLHQELLGAWLGWLDRRWGTGQWGAHWVEGTWVPWERWVGEAVWPPLDVSGLGLRMEIEARELELEVREFPVHFRDHKADKQWPGAPSRISPTAEVTMGMTKMHPTLIPVLSRRWNSLWLHSSNLTWEDQLIAIVPWERMRGESREGGMNGERLKESPGIFFFNMKSLAVIAKGHRLARTFIRLLWEDGSMQREAPPSFLVLGAGVSSEADFAMEGAVCPQTHLREETWVLHLEAVLSWGDVF